MTDVTELKCWPSCVNAIDWSSDGIIALASDERVELLFPNTVNFERDQDVPQWQHVPLKVPLFSNDELPLKEPAPLPNYSIGEEISNSAPISIAWSPPGLAKHRRCALATLTANLVLSIWSADRNPQEESSWMRRLVVNKALTEYFFNRVDAETSNDASEIREQTRLRTRIRSFAWAPASPNTEPIGMMGTRLSYDQSVVAISNDNNQIVLVAINSPTSMLGEEEMWSAKVLTHASILPGSSSIKPDMTAFEGLINQQRSASHLAWSPWVAGDDEYHSVLTYATNDNVRARHVIYNYHTILLDEEVIYPNTDVRFNGSLKWSSQIEPEDVLQLAVFTTSGLVHLAVSARDASIIRRNTHSMDGRLDQISGAVWDTAQQPTTRLHVSSLLSTLHNPTAVLEIVADELRSVGSPNWRDQIENNLVLFSVKNDLKGNSKAKVWGLAISPLGDFIAVCNSVHPSDMIEYGPPGDRRGTLIISALRHYNQLRMAFPSRNVSAENLLFTIKKLAENTVEQAEQIPSFADEIVHKLLQAYPAIEGPERDTILSAINNDSGDLTKLIEALKYEVFFSQQTLSDRYTLLVSQACKSTSSDDVLTTLIAYRLSTALQRLPSSLAQTSFSNEILAHSQQLLSLIDTLTTPDTMGNGSLLTAQPDITGRASAVTAAVEPDPDIRGTQPIADTCDFCAAPIPFTDLHTATCENGHNFPRCGLSFLAIQAPHITKYCGICRRPFLNEEFVAAQERLDWVKDGEQKTGAVLGVVAKSDADVGDQTNGMHTDRSAPERCIPENGDDMTLEQVHMQHRISQRSQCISRDCEELAGHAVRSNLSATLAKVLFLGCDVCIYCGGHFVG